MGDTTLPVDVFSRELRGVIDNPGAVRTSSVVSRTDFYGNHETWNVDIFRVEGAELAFLQCNRADGSFRLVLPREVMAAVARQRARATTVNRKRGARKAVATKLSEGQTIGNAAALKQARKARRRG